MKKFLVALLAGVMLFGAAFSLTACGGNLEGQHAFVFKSTGNVFGDLMYQGFKEYIEAKGGKATYQSPASTTVDAQVKLIDELIAKKVASITVSTNGDAGYNEVIQKAINAGIKVVSVDSKLNKDLRITHVDPSSQALVGKSLVHAATLIALKKDYPEDGNLAAAVETHLATYTGEEIKFGVLSASIDTPVQNGWIAQMETELARDIYQGKVSSTLVKKYGNDEMAASTTQATAFVTENNVDVIIAPTTIGMVAAGEILKTQNTTIKLTGLGLPTEMQGYMPLKATDNAFDFVCPYMMLWDVIDLGRVAGAATWAALKDGFEGKEGNTLTIPKMGEYEQRELKVVKHDDGGTLVVVGNPYTFYKGNMAEWKDKL